MEIATSFCPSFIYVYDALSTLTEYVVWCQDNSVEIPIDYFEGLFFCLPDFICELFDCDFIRFYDYIMRKGDSNES